MPDEAIRQQRKAFAALLQGLDQAAPVDVQQVLAAREQVDIERELDPEVATRL